jgi:hypothetical protein
MTYSLEDEAKKDLPLINTECGFGMFKKISTQRRQDTMPAANERK